MKKTLATITLILAYIVGLAGQTKIFTIQPTVSILQWTGYAGVGGYSPSGQINIASGVIETQNDEIVKGEVIIDMSTLQHENQRLQNHLRDKDFFHVEKYPEATFELSDISGETIKGVLTIRGVSKEHEMAFKKEYEGNQLVLTGTTQIDRTEYNIKYNSTSFFKNLGSYAIKDEFLLDFRMVAKSEDL